MKKATSQRPLPAVQLPPVPKNPGVPTRSSHSLSVRLDVNRELWEMAKLLREILGPTQQSMTKWVEMVLGQYVDHHMRDPILMQRIERALQWRARQFRTQRSTQSPEDIEAFWRNTLTDEHRWEQD